MGFHCLYNILARFHFIPHVLESITLANVHSLWPTLMGHNHESTTYMFEGSERQVVLPSSVVASRSFHLWRSAWGVVMEAIRRQTAFLVSRNDLLTHML